MKAIMSFAVLLTLTGSLSSNAAVNLEPGLWEITTTIKSKSGKFEKMVGGTHAQVLKNMTPEERKIYQDSLTEQGVSRLEGADTIMKDCITKEQLQRMGIPKVNKGCSQEVLKQTGNHIKLKYKCTGQMPATGVGEFKSENPKSYTITAQIDAMLAGQQEKLNANSQGKWLSSNCGNIKPSVRD